VQEVKLKASPNAIADDLAELAVDIASLAPDPANSRKHDERNIQTIKGSLARFGQLKPIVLAENGVTVVAGNGTLMAAKELGWKQIAAVRSSLDGSEATAYGIADNRTAELADWDADVLAQLIQSLDSELTTIAGFDDEEVEKLMAVDSEVETSAHDSGMLGTLEDYEALETKAMVFYFSMDTYTKIVEHLDAAMESEGLLSHAEVLEMLCLGSRDEAD
jgi:hypothetical protein